MMQKILVAAAASLLVGTAAAHADVIDVTGSYSLSYQATVGSGPNLQDVVHSPFSENLTVGTPTSATKFFSVQPAGSSGLCTTKRGKTTCTNDNTVSGIITVDFSIVTPDGTQKISDTGTYTADYNNPVSDSVVWTTNDLTVAYSSLDNLDIILGNASDWTIYPTISFDLVDAPPPSPVPEPGSFALLGTALLGLFGVARLRRARA